MTEKTLEKLKKLKNRAVLRASQWMGRHKWSLKELQRPKKFHIVLWAVVITTIIGIYGANNNSKFGCLYALDNDTLPNHFCYTSTLKVTNDNTTGVPLTYFPVRYQIPLQTYINNDYIDRGVTSGYSNTSEKRQVAKFWDYKSYQGTLNNSVEVIGVDANSTNVTSPFIYAIVPSLQEGVTTDVTNLMGNNELKRDQSLYIYYNNESGTGTYTDKITIQELPNQTYLDLGTDFEIILRVKPLDSTMSTHSTALPQVLNKMDSSQQGYKIELSKSNNQDYIKCTVNQTSTSTPYNYHSQPNSYKSTIKMRLSNGNLFCESIIHLFDTTTGVYSTNTQSTNVPSNQPVANSLPISMGKDMAYMHYYDLDIYNNSNKVLQMGFDANTLTETSPVCPFSTQATDYVNNHIGVWTLSGCNLHNNVNSSLSNVSQQVLSQSPNVLQTTVDWVGSPFDSNTMYKTQSSNTNIFLFSVWGKPSGWSVPDNFYYSLIAIPLGLFLGVGTWAGTRNSLIASAIAGLPTMFFITQGLLPYFLGFLWVAIIVVVAGVNKFNEGY